MGWLRATLFRARLGAGRQRAMLGLVLGQWLPVLGGLLVAAASLAADAFLLPAVGVAVLHPTSGQLVPVFASVVGLSGLVALAVTVSSGPLESALGRFPATVGTSLLEDEVRDSLLSLLLVTLTLALSLLVVTVLGLATPFTGAFAVALLAVATLAALVSYAKQRTALRHPTALAEYLAEQMERWLWVATRKARTDPGPGITTGLRDRYSDNFDRIRAICRSLLKNGQDEEAGEVLAVLAYTIVRYATRRRRLNPESAWFPYRAVPADGYSPSLTQIYERFGFGQAQHSEQDPLWFEKEVSRAWDELLEVAAGRRASLFCQVWAAMLEEMFRSAFSQQEFGLLDRLLEVATSGARHVGQLPELAKIADLPWLLVELLDGPGLQVERLEAMIVAERPLDAENAAGLPTELFKVVLGMGTRLENQTKIENDPLSYHTPRTIVAREATRLANERETEVRGRYLAIAASLSSRIAAEAADQGSTGVLIAAVEKSLLSATRLMIRGDISSAQAFLEAGLAHLDAALASDVPSVADKRRLINQLRALVLRSIYERIYSILKDAGPTLARILVDCAGADERARHDLLALLTIAHIASELRRDPEPREALLSGLDAADRDRRKYAREELEKAGEANLGLIMPLGRMVEYGEWAQPLLNEIRALDEREVRGPGEIGYDLEPAHESTVVRQLGKRDGFGNLDAAARLFLEFLLTRSASGNNAPEER